MSDEKAEAEMYIPVEARSKSHYIAPTIVCLAAKDSASGDVHPVEIDTTAGPAS